MVLGKNIDELWVLLIELLSQEILLCRVTLERVEQDLEEVLFQLFFIRLHVSWVALVRSGVWPLLLFSHLLLGEIFQILHQLINTELSLALVDCLAEDLQVALILHASLVPDHSVLFVGKELLLERLESLLGL